MVAPFTLPKDAIDRLGGGNPKVAGSILRRLFNVDPSSPTTVPASVVRAIGNGNINAGYRVLERFAQLLRQADGYRYEHVPTRYAKGGAVKKMTKATANYRDGFEDDKFCARCSMFRQPASCTLVEGKISRTSLCDHYKREG
jgi:hypothetical protein